MWTMFPCMLSSRFWIQLEIVESFAIVVGLSGFACCQINMSQARHFSVFLVCLGSAG
jgi:hypothetical protein